MSLTPTLQLPLPWDAEAKYTNLWPDHASSLPSNSTAFETGIDNRETYCIVCGASDSGSLEYCHIIPKCEKFTWNFMKERGYIPAGAKKVQHESRNGILMCASHHRAFDNYKFYIRWIQNTDQFVVINHSRHRDYEPIHGRVLHFSTGTKRCPFPTAFLWHESRVRGFHPLYDDRCVTFGTTIEQDEGIRQREDGQSGHGGDAADGGNGTGLHRADTVRAGPVRSGHGGNGGANHNNSGSGPLVGGQTASANGHDHMNTQSFVPAPLTGDDLRLWLQAARRHSSWTDCVKENLSWNGTAAENIEKYQRAVEIL